MWFNVIIVGAGVKLTGDKHLNLATGVSFDHISWNIVAN